MSALSARYLFCLLPLLLLGACSPENERSDINEKPPADPTQQFHDWLDDEFAEYLDFSPIAKTRRGDKSDYDKLDDVSEAAMDRRLAWRRASVEEMREQFDRSRLNDQGKLSWDLWEYLLEREEAGVPFRRHDYIFGRYGPQSGLPSTLISDHEVETVSDMRAYIVRLEASENFMGQYLKRAKLAASDGIRPPYFDYQRAIREARQVITGEPFEGEGISPLQDDATRKIDALAKAGKITDQEAQSLANDVKEALLSHLQPAYEEVIAWLKEDLTNVPEQASGARELPNGDAFYAYRLERMTTLPLTADEIHQIGLEEVARIHQEMKSIMDRVGFDGSLQEFFEYMRESDQFYFPNTDEGREAYLNLARDYLGDMEQALPDYFGILPEAGLVVKRVEAFREQAGGAAHYRRGTPDGSRPGTFYVHLADMKAVANYRLENLAYHEGLPGHHMQISIQQALDNIPQFRTYHGYTAYSEGWGLYAEYLGKDMGFYENPYSDFGRLTGELWRAIRLVVDTGIHARKWSEQRAIDYARDNSPRPKAAVKSEIHRYFNNPAQATAYKIGMLKILELRASAKNALGDQFDYGDFHDVVVGNGALPLPLLEREVNQWIASAQSR